MNKSYHIIGLMSGSSLDGLDLVHCHISIDHKDQFSHEILHTQTVSYDLAWLHRLKLASQLNAFDMQLLHVELGHLWGNWVNKFIEKNNIRNLDLIASHGHTILHDPGRDMTCQIGDLSALAAKTNTLVAGDFRSMDLARSGQGAPLVPIGDFLLFKKYGFCLNIGGIANISAKTNEGVLGYDICPANQMLNFLANKMNKPYDNGGAAARSGKISEALLKQLNEHNFYRLIGPKSLDAAEIKSDFFTLLESSKASLPDQLATVVEHIAIQISESVELQLLNMESQFKQMLVTGGGALNTFLLERIKFHCPITLIIPDSQTVNFKEALIIALMGLLRLLDKPNFIVQVTGASSASIGGALYNGHLNSQTE